MFYFKDTQKDEFIQRYNKINNNKHRNKLLAKLSMVTPEVKTNMVKIEEFLRMVDTIKFDDKGKFLLLLKKITLLVHQD